MAKSTKWDLSKIFSSNSEIEECKKKIEKDLDTLRVLKPEAKNNVYRLLDLQNEIFRNAERLFSYSYMKRDENSKVPESQKLAIETESLLNNIVAETSFISPCLLSLSDKEWDELKKDEKYAFYETYFSRLLRQKEHTLNEEMEFVISSYGEVAGASHTSYYMLTNADMKFPKMENTDEELTHASFVKFLMSKNRDLRKEAFEKYYDVYGDHENTISSTLHGNMKALITEAKLRKYNSAIEMALYPDNVDLSVYNALIDSVHKALPSLYDYYGLKKKILGLDEYHMYDVYVSISDYDREIPYEEAQEIVLEALKPMGEEYCSIIKKAFDESWIDVYPGEGKRSGAYSGGCYDSAPYILMNYNNNLESVFTLIHELGHSVHSYLSRKNNEYLYSDYTIFVAEVASTTNEMLLINYLLNKSEDKNEKIYLLNYYADMFKSTVFRQTMFAEFEKITHERLEAGEALTANDYKEIYLNLNKLYFGDNVISDERISLEWSRIPHFYTDFYVYKYATGLSAAAVLSQKILSGDKEALENYFNFLKDGNNHFPIEQLQKAGADMADPKTVDMGLESFKEKVQELKNLINQ